MRVVFDTNVFVSALVFPGGQGERALLRVLDGRDELVCSRAIVRELLEVLACKFARDREELAHVAVLIAGIAEIVDPDLRLEVLDDDADNRILECAVAGSAEIIVTGDKRMLELGTYRGIRILALAEFLKTSG